MKENSLKIKRLNCKISQTELARRIKVSTSIISARELGTREMPVRHAKKTAEILNCKWKDLYED